MTEALARAFSAVLIEWIGAEKMRTVIERNASPEYVHCCATHDFCDANMAMAEAWEKMPMLPPIFDKDGAMTEEVCKIWNSAWDAAKAAQFWTQNLKA